MKLIIKTPMYYSWFSTSWWQPDFFYENLIQEQQKQQHEFLSKKKQQPTTLTFPQPPKWEFYELCGGIPASINSAASKF